jgi:predicted acylesterase/phospholipase RssA
MPSLPEHLLQRFSLLVTSSIGFLVLSIFLVGHLLDELEKLIIRFRRSWAAIRAPLPRSDDIPNPPLKDT